MKKFYLILLICFCLNQHNIRAQVPVADSLALVEFYMTTNGPNWINHSNWLQTNVRYWWGVGTISSGGGMFKIIELMLNSNNLVGYINNTVSAFNDIGYISFRNNNLSGLVPEYLGNLPNLGTLLLSNNHFTEPLPFSLGDYNSNLLNGIMLDSNDFHGDFPDTIVKRVKFGLSLFGNKFTRLMNRSPNGINNNPFSAVHCENNMLTFDDVLSFITSNTPVVFSYAPQDSVLESIDTTVLVGSNLGLDSWVDTCQSNKYRWKKGTVYLQTSPVTNSQYALNNIQYADAGTYFCEISNIQAPLLKLQRRAIKVHVTGNIGIEQNPLSPSDIGMNYQQVNNLLEIKINLKETAFIHCGLYDLLGRERYKLFNGQTRQQELHYHLKNFLKPGLYVVRLEAGDKVMVKKVVVD
jgi:hypothetical protein